MTQHSSSAKACVVSTPTTVVESPETSQTKWKSGPLPRVPRMFETMGEHNGTKLEHRKKVVKILRQVYDLVLPVADHFNVHFDVLAEGPFQSKCAAITTKTCKKVSVYRNGVATLTEKVSSTIHVRVRYVWYEVRSHLSDRKQIRTGICYLFQLLYV